MCVAGFSPEILRVNPHAAYLVPWLVGAKGSNESNTEESIVGFHGFLVAFVDEEVAELVGHKRIGCIAVTLVRRWLRICPVCMGIVLL